MPCLKESIISLTTDLQYSIINQIDQGFSDSFEIKNEINQLFKNFISKILLLIPYPQSYQQLITPLPTRFEKSKASSDIDSKITPLLTESAENKVKIIFKTPINENNEINQIQPIDNLIENYSDNRNQTKFTLNSFNKSEERIQNFKFENTHNNTDNYLFKIFDECLKSIGKENLVIQNENINENSSLIGLFSSFAKNSHSKITKFVSKLEKLSKIITFKNIMEFSQLRKNEKNYHNFENFEENKTNFFEKSSIEKNFISKSNSLKKIEKKFSSQKKNYFTNKENLNSRIISNFNLRSSDLKEKKNKFSENSKNCTNYNHIFNKY